MHIGRPENNRVRVPVELVHLTTDDIAANHESLLDDRPLRQFSDIDRGNRAIYGVNRALPDPLRRGLRKRRRNDDEPHEDEKDPLHFLSPV